MKKAPTALAVLGILGASVVGAAWLIAAREEPKRKDRDTRGVAVETIEVSRSSHRLDVRAAGVVVPARSLDVFPQVSGRIVWLHERLIPGTFVQKGQELFRIEARDYRLAVERAEAELQQASSAMALETGQQQIARQEWEFLSGPAGERNELGEEARALALRQPQLRAAESALAVARTNLSQARLNAARTSFASPFEAVIVEATAEIGQLASPQTLLARLVGTEKFWVRVSIPTKQIPAISIPGIDGDEGAPVSVRQHVGERVIERTGRIVRLLSNLEPGSRMARLLVEIDDPYGLEASSDGDTRPYPILLETYIDVVIRGKNERSLVKLARGAVREGNLAYVLDEEGRLDIRQLEVAWQEPDSVLVHAGLEDGDRIVVSPLSGAVEGMKLRDVTGAAVTATSEEKSPPDG